MKRLVFLAVVLPLVLAPGCPVHKFEITMRPTEDGGVQRELIVWTEDGQAVNVAGEDVLSVAEKAYGDAGRTDEGKQHFGGTFAGVLPEDLVHEGFTSHGFVGTNRCPLGRVVTYVEQMPGRNDLQAVLAEIGEVADTLAQVWVAWARQQPSLQAEPEKLDRLVAFIEGELRSDALNLMLMGWRGITRVNVLEDANLDDDGEGASGLWRAELLGAASYLVQRGYFRPDEIALLRDDESSATVAMRGILRKAAAAIGCTEEGPWPAALERLRDPEAGAAAFEQGLTSAGLSQDEFDEQYMSLMPEILGTGTCGRIVWQGRAQPLETNGTWDGKERELSWEAEGRQGCETPQLLYAIWVEPDEESQIEHFGRVMLEGERLVAYVAWRAGLPATQCREWDAFVVGLQPSEELADRLKRFRFSVAATMPSTQPTTDGESGGTRGARLILGD